MLVVHSIEVLAQHVQSHDAVFPDLVAVAGVQSRPATAGRTEGARVLVLVLRHDTE
jgi:hypothetical protein